MDSARTYPCPLDENVQVIEIPFGLGATTHAMIVSSGNKGAIVLDANLKNELWFTEDHLNAIFAHELGHLAMGDVEEDAENWAISRLGDLGMVDAQKLLLDRGVV